MHCVPAFRIVSESMRGNQAANLGGWSCAIADRWSIQNSPPLWRSSSYLSFAGHVLGIRRCFELAFYPGFGWFRFMTHWQGVETTFGSPVSRVDMARWTEDHLCRRTFPGRPVWSGAPMANRFSLVIQMLASMGLTCLGMASSFLYFYIQESGIYPKCDISSST
jgi:hypothetical protein